MFNEFSWNLTYFLLLKLKLFTSSFIVTQVINSLPKCHGVLFVGYHLVHLKVGLNSVINDSRLASDDAKLKRITCIFTIERVYQLKCYIGEVHIDEEQVDSGKEK